MDSDSGTVPVTRFAHWCKVLIRRTRWLAVIGATLVCTVSCSPVVSARVDPGPAAAIAGYYEGALNSREHGEVAFSLNLREENDTVVGTMITPLGDFPVTQDSLGREQLALRFVVGDGDVGVISARRDADEILGTWQLAGDGGTIAMRRVGPPRPPVEAAAPTIALSPAAWREDLRHLAAELPLRHGNAFHTVRREEFEDSINALDARLASLQGHEVFAAIGRIVAMVGDGHTYLQLPESFHRYPIRLYAFGDTLRITHAAAGYEHLLGARLLGIGGMDIAAASHLVGRQIARENEWYVRRELPWFLIQAELLHAHGLAPSLTEADWAVETVSGERLTVRLSALAPGGDVRWVSAAQAVPLYRRRAAEDLSYTFLPASGTLYVAFRGYPARAAFRDFFDEVFRFSDENPVERMIIDMRDNSGGDFTKARDLLLPRLEEHPLDREGRLFVAIGRNTFSAAMSNAADFLNETNATLVGEPTGGRPNGWQEKGQFTLPHSNLTVSLSTQYYEFLDEDVPAVMPHRHIPLYWEDFRAGRDPVLEWILAQPLPR